MTKYNSTRQSQSNYHDRQALKMFLKKRVDEKMIQYLAYHTNQIIKIQPQDTNDSTSSSSSSSSPLRKNKDTSLDIPSLEDFIKGLIIGSNVQTCTLMTTVIFLKRLQKIIPKNVYGIETTRHRIFVGCLIIVAKMLNDSSPLNKHWCNYTNGLLTLLELNIIEKELLEYFNWNLKFDELELIQSLETLLMPLKHSIQQHESMQSNSNVSSLTRNSVFSSYSTHSRSESNVSIPSIPSTLCLNSLANYSNIKEENEQKQQQQVQHQQQQHMHNNNMHSNVVVQIKRNNSNNNNNRSVLDTMKNGYENNLPQLHSYYTKQHYHYDQKKHNTSTSSSSSNNQNHNTNYI